METIAFGAAFRDHVAATDLTPVIGIYDVFSATLAAQHFDALFVSGFGFAASHYGLPDIGFIAWADLVAFVQRVRAVLPRHHLLVDIDDGYCDTHVACHVASLLESIGASGVVLEDQARPRRCGHLDGKVLLELPVFVEKLRAVLASRRDLYVVARTDAADPDEIARRIDAFTEAGADAVLVDAVRTLDQVRALKARTRLPVVFNQIAGGKSPPVDLEELRDSGAKVALFSTPCLFAAQEAVAQAMVDLAARNGRLPDGGVGLADCHALLRANLDRRHGRPR